MISDRHEVVIRYRDNRHRIAQFVEHCIHELQIDGFTAFDQRIVRDLHVNRDRRRSGGNHGCFRQRGVIGAAVGCAGNRIVHHKCLVGLRSGSQNTERGNIASGFINVSRDHIHRNLRQVDGEGGNHSGKVDAFSEETQQLCVGCPVQQIDSFQFSRNLRSHIASEFEAGNEVWIECFAGGGINAGL